MTSPDGGRYAVVAARRSTGPATDGKLRARTHEAVTAYLTGRGATPGEARWAADMIVLDHVGPGVEVVALTADSLAAYLRLAQGSHR